MLSKRAAAQQRVLRILNKLNIAINDIEEIIYKLNNHKTKVYMVVRDTINTLREELDLFRVGYVGTQATANIASSVFFDEIFSALKTNLNQVEEYASGAPRMVALDLLAIVRDASDFKRADELTSNRLTEGVRDCIYKEYKEALTLLKNTYPKLQRFISMDIAQEVEKIRTLSVEYEIFADNFLNTTVFGLDDLVGWYNELQKISNVRETEEVQKIYKKPSVREQKFRPRDVDVSFYSTGINSMTVYEDKFGNFYFTKLLPPKTAFKELFISNLFRGLTKTIPWNIQYGEKQEEGLLTQISSIGGKSYPSSMMSDEFEISPEETAMYLILLHVFGHEDMQNPDNVRMLMAPDETTKSIYSNENEKRFDSVMFIDFELAQIDNQRMLEDLREAEDFNDLIMQEDNYFLNKEMEYALQRQWKAPDNEKFRKEVKYEIYRILSKLTRKYLTHKATQAYETIYGSTSDIRDGKYIYIRRVVNTILKRKKKLLNLIEEE